MNHDDAVEALALLRKVVGQARDETSLQNWGVIWMLHGLTNGAGFCLTNVLMWQVPVQAWQVTALWMLILAVNIGSIFLLRGKGAGTRTFIERQIWFIWSTFIVAAAMTFAVNHLLGTQVIFSAPVLALLAAFALASMGAVIDSHFFWASAVFFLFALVMALLPQWQFFILGGLWTVFQCGVGMLLHRNRRRRMAESTAEPVHLV